MDLITLAAAKAYTDKKSGGGGANIITANSKAELPDPSTVAEGTIALVPSEGGGGLPVVTITTQPVQSGGGEDVKAYLTADESELVNAIGANSFSLCFPFIYAGMPVKMTALMTPIAMEYEGTTLVLWYGGTVTFEQSVLTIAITQEDIGVYNLTYYEA